VTDVGIITNITQLIRLRDDEDDSTGH